MSSNSFGEIFRITTYGESHGSGMGVIIDACPPGLEIDNDFIQKELDRRRPGQSKLVSQRKESDSFQILSGVFEGKTTGTPIHIFIPNEDVKSKDYLDWENIFRPSHADFTYEKKYGIRDFRGGGRSSARETVARVAAGAVAKLFLRKLGIEIFAYTEQIGTVKLNKSYKELNLNQVDEHPTRCPDKHFADEMETLVNEIRKEGDTVGGIVFCVIKGCPPGLGEPVFDKLHASLANAVLGINACKGFEYGSGFSSVTMKGSEHNDIFIIEDEKIVTRTNYSGGIQGGISNGMDIYFRAAFKPVATIMKEQQTVDKDGNLKYFSGKGRHDPCVVPRAVPIVEAMTALVLIDFCLRTKALKW